MWLLSLYEFELNNKNVKYQKPNIYFTWTVDD